MQDGQVRVRIGMDVGAFEFAAVIETHGDFVGSFDHMVVGENQPGLIDDHARAGSFALRHLTAGRHDHGTVRWGRCP